MILPYIRIFTYRTIYMNIVYKYYKYYVYNTSYVYTYNAIHEITFPYILLYFEVAAGTAVWEKNPSSEGGRDKHRKPAMFYVQQRMIQSIVVFLLLYEYCLKQFEEYCSASIITSQTYYRIMRRYHTPCKLRVTYIQLSQDTRSLGYCIYTA